MPGEVEGEGASRVAGSDGADDSEGATGGEWIFRNDEAEVSPPPMFERCRLDCGGKMTGEVEDAEGCATKEAFVATPMTLQNVMPKQSSKNLPLGHALTRRRARLPKSHCG